MPWTSRSTTAAPGTPSGGSGSACRVDGEPVGPLRSPGRERHPGGRRSRSRSPRGAARAGAARPGTCWWRPGTSTCARRPARRSGGALGRWRGAINASCDASAASAGLPAMRAHTAWIMSTWRRSSWSSAARSPVRGDELTVAGLLHDQSWPMVSRRAR